jgi:hypothetical protein
VHGGFGGAEPGKVENGKIVLFGGSGRPARRLELDHAVHDQSAGIAGQRIPVQLSLRAWEGRPTDRPSRVAVVDLNTRRCSDESGSISCCL